MLPSETGGTVQARVARFYDIGSPYYRSVYSEHIHDGYYVTGRETPRRAQENLTRLLADKADVRPGERVLDVGCGLGGSSVWLARERGAVTTGITLSPVQARLAAELAHRAGADSTFLVMDAMRLDFNIQFNVVWVMAALTHFPDQPAFLREAAALLKPGGRIAIFDWMLGEGVDPQERAVRPVTRGMLLTGLYPPAAYTGWLEANGCRVTYNEDITARTLQTWDDALGVLRRPSVWRLALRIPAAELRAILAFFLAIRPMRAAMRRGKLRSVAIVARKA